MRPKTLKILGKPFKFEYLTDQLDADLNGECDCDKQLIRIREGQPLEAEQDTVLHELIHAIDEAVDSRMTESQVKRLATGLLAVFKENQRLATYLRRKTNATSKATER